MDGRPKKKREARRGILGRKCTPLKGDLLITLEVKRSRDLPALHLSLIDSRIIKIAGEKDRCGLHRYYIAESKLRQVFPTLIRKKKDMQQFPVGPDREKVEIRSLEGGTERASSRRGSKSGRIF